MKYLSNVDVVMKLRFSCQQLVTSGKACKAGNSDNELTLSDGIKYLSNVDVVMKLRCSCQQLATAVKAGNSFLQVSKLGKAAACNSCQSFHKHITAAKAGNR